MRILGFLLIALSLLFSSGGVAIVSQADAADEISVEIEATTQPGGTCSAPQPPQRYVISTPLRPRNARSTISLNSRGYNYLKPGDFRPPTPSTTSGPAPGLETDQPDS